MPSSPNSSAEQTIITQYALSRPTPRTLARITWMGKDGLQVVPLRERMLVGSAPKAALVIADPQVSRIHAELEPREDGTWVRDLGSRNGTFVEGILVTAARVPDGGKIRIGSTELSIDFPPDADEVDVWSAPRFGRLLGTSIASRQLFAYLAKIATTDSPVLIQGETGTGKELVAQAIHESSPRASRPFVIVDCAALPENLIESELFGHAKGAFTGALTAREGAIEAAEGGTVFLDEIGELPLALQPRLLRVLESGTIRRLGETARRTVNVRFLSATHRDLRTMVNAGAFREDLYFRLAVLPVNVAPLRDRLEDIPALVESFLPPGIRANPEDLRQLAKRPWLGNVRELRNFVHRALAVGTRQAMEMPFDAGRRDPAPKTSATPVPPSGDMVNGAAYDRDFKTFREQWIDHGEREYLRRLLERHGRNIQAAAREADVDRTYVYRLIKKYDL